MSQYDLSIKTHSQLRPYLYKDMSKGLLADLLRACMLSVTNNMNFS